MKRKDLRRKRKEKILLLTKMENIFKLLRKPKQRPPNFKKCLLQVNKLLKRKLD